MRRASRARTLGCMTTDTRLRWLADELEDWQREGLVAPEQADAIRSRYLAQAPARRRLTLGRLLLGIGGVFVGVGLIWLVAANLDSWSPVLRFGVVAGLWLCFLLGGEVLAARGTSPAVVLAVRTLAALGVGATVFQAAQSLQVPAWEPALLGWWAAGTLVHAYAVRALPPLLVAVATGSAWFVWQVLLDAGSPFAGILAASALGSAAVAAAVLHERGGAPFAPVWRGVGVLWLLVALFVAALPFAGLDHDALDPWLVAGLVVAALLVLGATVLGRGTSRFEGPAAAAVVVAAVGLTAWDAGESATSVGVQDWAHALVSVGVYVLVAVGVVALGVLRSSTFLTVVATGALVVFTTFQSFAVFAAIIQGAWLFVVLGAIFLGTGFLFDRARRELASTLGASLDPTDGSTR